jgi:hypothetical protein
MACDFAGLIHPESVYGVVKARPRGTPTEHITASAATVLDKRVKALSESAVVVACFSDLVWWQQTPLFLSFFVRLP